MSAERAVRYPLRYVIALSMAGWVAVIIVLLSINSYRSQYQMAYEQAIDLARAGAQPIRNLLKDAVGGGNYANIQTKEALKLYRGNDKLRFMRVKGRTNEQGKPFGFFYTPDTGVLRTTYPEGYAPGKRQKASEAKAKLQELEKDSRRYKLIEEMRAKAQEKLAAYQKGQEQIQQLRERFGSPPDKAKREGQALRDGHIHLLLPIGNEGGGRIWMVLDAPELTGLWWQILWDVAPLSVILLVVSGVSSWWWARRIGGDTERLSQVMTRVQDSGDLTLSVDIPRQNELGLAADSFNAMIERFREQIRSDQDQSNQLATASEELSTTADEINRSSQTTRQRVEDVSSSAQEVNNVVQDVANNIQSVSQSAQQATEITQGGQQAVKRAAQRLDQLKQSTGRVTEMTATIESIAKKTDLLALNAAIEAANAGEQGKGFAVVADEVRKLAEQTSGATSQVNDVVGELGEQSDASIQAMDQVQSTMDKVLQAIEHTSETANQIAAAAEELSATMGETTDSMGEIDSHVGQVAGSVSQIKESARQLEGLAQELRSALDQYRVQ